MYRILVSDPLEKTGLAQLRASGHEVTELAAEDKPRILELIDGYDALVVRSGTQVTAELLAAGRSLRVVGRAGIGVDNVDTDAATELGILVVNAPTANLVSATEHTFALLLALARNVAKADADLKSESWNRKKFVGTELQGKKLGIIGFGRIGQAVARRARAFDMEILAFDPFLPDDVIRRADARPRTLDALMAEADVVTLHVPLTDDTRDMLSGERLRLMKKGAMLVNCARGGVVDEATLLELLDSGHLAGAGLDVFSQEPPVDYRLACHEQVVATPHLGAQTSEAQVRISTQTAKMVLAALDGSLAVTAVNLPFRPAGAAGEPYLRLAEKLSKVAAALAPSSLSRVEVELQGLEESLHVPVTIAAVKGALVRPMGSSVNYVNAETIAKERGIEIKRTIRVADEGYPNQIIVRLGAGDQEIEVRGALFHGHDARVVGMLGYQLEFRPKGSVLLVRNQDVPGVVGELGTRLGRAQVNIAEIHLARRSESDRALAVARLDHDLDEAILSELRDLPVIDSVEMIDLGDV